MNLATRIKDHYSHSLWFLIVTLVGYSFLGLLKFYDIALLPIPGGSFFLAGIVFVLAFRKGFRKWIPLSGYAAFGILQVVLSKAAPPLSANPIWLFGLQSILFGVWTLWLFRFHPWSKDLYTVWTLSCVFQLVILPSLSFSQELLGFGVLILGTLWVLVVNDRLAHPSPTDPDAP